MPKLTSGRRASVGVALLACSTAFAAPALAENELRGEVVIELGRNTTTGTNFKRLETSVGTEFANGVGLQLDLGIGKYQAITSASPSAAVHLYYTPTDTWAFGAFALAEDRRPGNSYYFGVEAAYSDGPFSAEVYGAYREDMDTPTDGSRFGIELAYAPDSWRGFGLSAGAHHETGLPTGSKSIGYLGAGYTFASGVTAGITLGRTDRGDTVATAAISIDLGRGARFSRRDSRGVFAAY